MARTKTNKNQVRQNALNDIDDMETDQMRELLKLNYKIKPKFKSKKQKELSDLIKDNRITFVTGAPGTGKSFIALKTGLELLKEKSANIGDMLLTTPVVEISRSIGSLPGDLDTKISQYFQHFYDNMSKIIDSKTLKFLKETEIINDKIVNFIRGSTFGKTDDVGNSVGTYCVLDEGQNLYISEMKAYISRLGEGSKMVILGDIEQCDLKLRKNEKNGLQDAIERFKNIEGIGFFHFDEDDIVRDPFLIEIMKRYK
jgi:phosphate starvation-inducible PhoH-like protein